ncbi:MAG: heavy metal translocating P-type ATPase [Thermoflexales bacterium]|nr:heavy metal translocating P-type ATPase [Thermoflexales bacterium]
MDSAIAETAPDSVQVELPVLGMTCANCALTVERALRRVPGVAEVSVNLATEQASVRYRPGQVALAEIVAAIRKAGYDVAEGVDDTSAEPIGAEHAARAAEIADRRRRALVGLIFALPTFALSMSRDLGVLEALFGASFSPAHAHAASANALINALLLLLAAPVQVFTGFPFYVHAFKALRNRTANMDVLVALGATAAFGWSLAVLLGLAQGHVYFETSALILALISVGKYLEARAKGRASEAVRRLMQLAPKTAHVIREGVERELPVSQIRIGDVVVTRPGERIAADGVVIGGHSTVDESAISGESVPRDKTLGDIVIGGTLNLSGTLRYEATRVGRETLLAQIVRLVAQAQGSKAPIQTLADRVSAVFVPAVIVVALATLVAWWTLGGDAERALINAVAVLVVACPCALGLATPTAIMVGMGKGAEHGVLFKSSIALEQLAYLKVAVFDKTGTLTQGRPSVQAVIAFGEQDPARVLQLAALAEHASEHPLAHAICAAAQARGLTLSDPDWFQALPGRGVIAVVRDGTQRVRVAVGNAMLMHVQGVTLNTAMQQQIQRLRAEGHTIAIVAVEGQAIGAIGLMDVPKPEAHDGLAALRAMGVRTIMLTGDHRQAAQAIAHRLGIDEVIAEVLPTDKAEHIARLREGLRQREGKRRTLAMIGDGINDAPALAAADVGIAMARGADIALEAADVTLVHNDVRDVARAVRLAQQTLRGVRQNLFWAFFYNVLLIPTAALGVFQEYGPILAAGAMAFSSLFVVGNSLRLRRLPLR